MNFTPTAAQEQFIAALDQDWGVESMARPHPGRRGYHPSDILEMIVGFHKRNDRWPVSMDFRRNPQLPHNQTMVKHFQSIERAIELAQARLER